MEDNIDCEEDCAQQKNICMINSILNKMQVTEINAVHGLTIKEAKQNKTIRFYLSHTLYSTGKKILRYLSSVLIASMFSGRRTGNLL